MPLYALAEKVDTASTYMSSAINVLTILAVLILPFLVGGWLARRLRMPDYGWKIGLCLATLVVSSYILAIGWPPKLGIDLSGGAILIYQVDKGEKKDVNLEDLCQKVGLRVNPGGVREVMIRPYGHDQIEITIPNVDNEEAARIEKRISAIGSLEFRILANTRDHAAIVERANRDKAKELRDDKGKLLAWWVPVKVGEEHSFDSYKEIATRTRKVAGKDVTEILVVGDEQNVKGEQLQSAAAGQDQQGGPCVEFSFTPAGSRKFGALTADNLPDKTQGFTRKLGIILDGYLCSAPSIQSQITDRGQITGRFTQQEVTDLVNVLNSGSLPATLSPEPISKLMIGPTLGLDTIKSSSYAMILASILIPLFMLVYYRFSGAVAIVALVLNMLVLLALMISVKAALTLAGLAGLALTIGMAVDNNVLVYERLREELAGGATIRMAIRNSFARASAVIIDANLTTLIAAVVLYAIGTDQVKGFAVTLGFGVTISMFTSVFVSRVIFDVAEKHGWIKKLSMLHVIGHTNFDFMRLFPYTGTLSLVITILGLVVTGMRGQSLLDIDFTGGTSVQTVFAEPVKSTEVVREAVATLPDDLPDVVVSNAKFGDEPELKRFIINTSNGKLSEVQNTIKDLFKGQLATNSVAIEKVEAIPAEAPKAAAPKAEAEGEKKEVAEVVSSPFAGGTKATLKFSINIDHNTVADLLKKAIAPFDKGDTAGMVDLSNEKYHEGDKTAYPLWNVQLKLPKEEAEKAFASFQKNISAEPYFPSSNTIGGAVASNTRQQAIYALVVSWGCMLLYLWIRFQGVAFGLAAVIALVHDVLIMLAAIALSYYVATPLGFLGVDQFKVNLTIVAAFLTIVGYSVNDTIIVFDRIREVRGKSPEITRDMVNQSVNQTLSRTLITSFTVMLVCVVLYVAGGPAIHGMAFALMIGVGTGTFSSIYVAAPILLWLVKDRRQKKVVSTKV